MVCVINGQEGKAILCDKALPPQSCLLWKKPRSTEPQPSPSPSPSPQPKRNSADPVVRRGGRLRET